MTTLCSSNSHEIILNKFGKGKELAIIMKKFLFDKCMIW